MVSCSLGFGICEQVNGTDHICEALSQGKNGGKEGLGSILMSLTVREKGICFLSTSFLVKESH